MSEVVEPQYDAFETDGIDTPDCEHADWHEGHSVIRCMNCKEELFYLEIGPNGNDYWESA